MKCALETNKYTNEGESLDSISRLPKGEKKCKKIKNKKNKKNHSNEKWMMVSFSKSQKIHTPVDQFFSYDCYSLTWAKSFRNLKN